jgi:hypothetical protein
MCFTGIIFTLPILHTETNAWRSLSADCVSGSFESFDSITLSESALDEIIVVFMA